MEDTPPTDGGLWSAVSRLFKTLQSVAANRLELFLTELKEERLRMFEALLLAALVIVCGMMTLIMVTLMIVVAFWDTHRFLVLTLLTVAYAAAATVAFWKLRSRLQRWQAYAATLEEFKKTAHVSKSRTSTLADAERFAGAAKRPQSVGAGRGTATAAVAGHLGA
jgi:uncharacterized membrane protein YqjE